MLIFLKRKPRPRKVINIKKKVSVCFSLFLSFKVFICSTFLHFLNQQCGVFTPRYMCIIFYLFILFIAEIQLFSSS